MNNILENWEEGFREKVKDATYPAGGYSDQEQEIDEGELIEFIKELLQAQREKDFYEVGLLCKIWKKELGLESKWIKNLHPADVLDKYIFPEIRDKLDESSNCPACNP